MHMASTPSEELKLKSRLCLPGSAKLKTGRSIIFCYGSNILRDPLVISIGYILSRIVDKFFLKGHGKI